MTPIAADIAGLPTRYVEIKRELALLQSLDLCKEWSDRAAAIRAYAQMARDPELEALARRVRAWATRRAGELLAEINPAANHHDPANLIATTDATDPSNFISRKAAAEEAGLSERQHKVALRIASIPLDKFEHLVEVTHPASLQDLDDYARELRGDVPGIPEELQPMLRKLVVEAVKPRSELAGRTLQEFECARIFMFETSYYLGRVKGLNLDLVRRGLSAEQLTKACEYLAALRKIVELVDEAMGVTQ